jgi:peptide/nickel transport system substrate-binding protein
LRVTKKLGGVAVAIALIGGATTAGANAPALASDARPASSERADTLTVAVLATLVNGLSASASEFGNRNLYFQAVYDGLLRAEPDGTIVPWLATEWSYNDDSTVLTMTLRDDVTFTDGTPFNAEAAAQNLIRFRDGPSPDASNLSLMTDAVAVDDTTLEITLSAPDPALLNYLGRNAGLMQSPATFDSADEASNPVGTGPYILNQGDTVADSVYTYNANPDYWAPEFVKYDNFVIRVIQDPTATLNAIRAGEVNAANIINLDAIPEVEGAGWDLHTQELDWSGLTLVDRDGSMGTPLGEPAVRQAINHAFDREAILEGIAGGHGTVTTQVFRADSPGFDPALDEAYPYDPERAQELLAEAGYADGFTLDLPTTAVLGETTFAIIADQLGAVGIDVNFVDESADYFSPILAPNYPAYFMILEQAPNDWQFVNFLLSENAVWNPSHYSDETSQELIATIQTTEGEEQATAVAELGRYVHDQAWFAPWYRVEANYATDSNVDVVIQTGNAVPYLFNFSPQG